ncbi:MAG: aldolase [Candidatus Hydrogenedentes bacterium]|nr:aldolase [Candidatus Hydrogenedentota bacterium]
MGIGKQIRLRRIFAHPSGRLCSVAVDHFITYQKGLPRGLVNVPRTLAQLVRGQPDAVTMEKGMAKNAWGPHAGRVPLIISSVIFTPDDSVIEMIAHPEEVLRMGADAIAVAIGVRGPNEGRYLKMLTDIVEEAGRIELPVMAHIYPRDFSDAPRVVHDPDNILWAVRCGLECGADVIKTPYTGDVASFRDIVATSPVPVVAAGGPKANTLRDAVGMMGDAVKAGACGATIGRNIWGTSNPTKALLAFKAVIHDRRAPLVALRNAGLS